MLQRNEILSSCVFWNVIPRRWMRVVRRLWIGLWFLLQGSDVQGYLVMVWNMPVEQRNQLHQCQSLASQGDALSLLLLNFFVEYS